MRLLLISVCMFLFSVTGNEKLLGRWETQVSPKGNTTSVVFNADNTFEAYMNHKLFTSGTYKLNNDTFSLIDNGCDGKEGVYLLTFFSNGDSIRLAAIHDECNGRKEGMIRTILGRKK